MHRRPAFSRYRPRMATLFVLLVTGALLVLANLTDEVHVRRAPEVLSETDLTFDVREPDSRMTRSLRLCAASNGWPLLWNQYVFQVGYGMVTVGWRFSAGRLVCDVVIWLVMLAAPPAACEWALRRYRPRLRFSLRAVLAAVSLAAAFCGWFAWARHRADTEDAIGDAIKAEGGDVWLERWGPKWLDLIGADRYRRRIVAARVPSTWLDNGDEQGEDDEESPTGEEEDQDDRATGELHLLSQSAALQCLFVDAWALTPDLARALREFRQLRTLSIDTQRVLPGACEVLGGALGCMKELRVLSVYPGGAWGGDEDANSEADWRKRKAQMCHEYLTAIGKATSLERLRLESMTIRSESLACLAGLTRLKSLSLINIEGENAANSRPLLSSLPPLANLEAFEASSEGTKICDLADDDVRYLARLPRLKSLRVSVVALSDAGFAQLASLNSIEELQLLTDLLSSTELESLVRLEHLRKLHIPLEHKQPDGPNGPRKIVPHVGPGDLRKSVRALQTLRQTHPGIVIDDDFNALAWEETSRIPANCETRERMETSWVRPAIDAWKKAGCPPIPAAKPAR